MITKKEIAIMERIQSYLNPELSQKDQVITQREYERKMDSMMIGMFVVFVILWLLFK